jgi:hypothetical protein
MGFSTDLLLGSAATRRDLLLKLDEATRREKTELFMFYFAGHATRIMVGGTPVLHFVLYDTTEATANQPLSIRELKMLLEKLPPFHKLAVLDTVNGTSGLVGNIAGRARRPSTTPVLQFLAGCQDEQWAAETREGGVFTQNFLRTWHEAAPATSLPELVNQVAKRMANQKAQQDPKLLTVEGSGTIYLHAK